MNCERKACSASARAVDLCVDGFVPASPGPGKRPGACAGAQLQCRAALGDALLDELLGPHASIYERMAPRAQKVRPEQGDLRALAPCPEVDSALGRLVAIIQGDYGRHTRDCLITAEERHHIGEAVARQIRGDARLQARARELRSIAALAETAMEHHYSEQLYALLQDHRPTRALPPAGSLRTHALERCLGAFPYTRNYRLLTLAELRLLHQPATPRLLRDAEVRELSALERERFRRELSALRGWAASARADASLPLRFAVCGAGPLPISGLMLHTLTDADVALIEREPRAARAARRMIAQLERLQVLRSGAVHVAEQDATQLRFAPRPGSEPRHDVLLIASLVDAQGKAALARHLHEAARAGAAPRVLARSAAALCAELAYQPLETLQLSELCLPFCGEQAPRAATHADPDTEQLVHSPHELLNSTELFHHVPLTAAQQAALGWLSDLRGRLLARSALCNTRESHTWTTTQTPSCSF